MYRILVADDEDFAREGIERIISKISGTKVVAVCKNGAEAKEYLENHAADAVLSDIRMPDMDGLELAEWISLHRRECKIVLLSAYGEFSYAQKAVKYGVKDYLMKPIRAVEIKKVVEQLIQERKCMQEESVWIRNLKQELIELDTYHAIVDSGDLNTKKWKQDIYFSQYEIKWKDEKANDKSDDLMMAGLTNIFRLCAPQCTPVLKERGGIKAFEYILLSERKDTFPDVEEIEEAILRLLKQKMTVHLVACANVTALTEQKSELVQDEIEDMIIVKAKEYMNDHLKDNVSREDVAEYVHLDPSYFSKYFKKKSGVNFSDYLMKTRMEKVQKLLDKGWKVYDAALEAGFQNRNYFNTVFKKYTGMNPTKYKHREYDLREENE